MQCDQRSQLHESAPHILPTSTMQGVSYLCGDHWSLWFNFACKKKRVVILRPCTDRCKALIQFRCPYLGAGGVYDATTVAAINRHLIKFLWTATESRALQIDPGMQGSNTPCTAEQALKGCKHGCWSAMVTNLPQSFSELRRVIEGLGARVRHVFEICLRVRVKSRADGPLCNRIQYATS